MKIEPGSPMLSLILCSRNDQYMGNAVWRLETALNYIGEKVRKAGREHDVEVVVADWGSETPLAQVLRLTAAASRLVSFAIVPPEVARPLQKDSPFPEVIALNAAARRARGEYIGRIDQDTLVGKRFLDAFFELCEGKQRLGVPLESALLFSGRRDIPYRLAMRCPPLWVVDRFIECRETVLPVEGIDSSSPFYMKGVGIWLMHCRLWNECGGYDERMIYMNGMEINMMHRLMKKYRMVDLGLMTGHDFYHLEHYHPWAVRKSSTYRKVNPRIPFWNPDLMNPNGEAWGLAASRLPVAGPSTSQSAMLPATATLPASHRAQYLFVMMVVDAQAIFDGVVIGTVRAASVWRNRAGAAWQAVKGRPLLSWPHLLRDLWAAKWTARMARQEAAQKGDRP